MYRLRIKYWLGVAGLGMAAGLGCSETHHHLTPCATCAQHVACHTCAKPEVVVQCGSESGQVVVLPRSSSEPQMGETSEEAEAGADRRSFADITASPSYDHAPDYSWLQGELQYVHVRKEWRLRYASVDEEDRYGGGVWIANPGSLVKYKDGQIVRVSGHVVDPENKQPVYQINSVEAPSGSKTTKDEG